MIGTIEQETAACRKRFEGVEVGSAVRCCHHERLLEILEKPAENRIWYILTYKGRGEQARRLHEFWPIPQDMYADYEAKHASLYADYKAKHAPLYADYEAKHASLDADYKAKRASLYADYKAKRAPLYADYEAKRAPLDELIIALVSDTTWNGESIL